jgi:poly(glycerol-phosphate) alpha-glucosyltransferase
MIRCNILTGPVSRSAGGLYESVRRLVQELRITGIEVAVLGSFDEFTKTDIAAWDPVTIRAFRTFGPRQFGYSHEYLEFLKAYRPHLIHTHGIWIYSSMATLIHAKRCGIPYMISPHGMLDPWALRNSRWKKIPAYWLYERAHLNKASVMRALCESEAESFRKFGLKNPIAIIPNGIDLPEESPRKAANHEGKKTLLSLGRIHPKKGLSNLIRAFARSRGSRGENHEQWHLLMVGWDQGGYEVELMQLCKELELSISHKIHKNHTGNDRDDADVIFYGPAFKEEKELLLNSADAFVLPSFSEGLPMSVLEAWAHGLPVVMTPECNLPEGFAADAAIRIETDVESIAQGLEALFSMNDADLKEMGARGRALVRQKFTWQNVAGQMKDVYDWMLGGGMPPSCVEIS